MIFSHQKDFACKKTTKGTINKDEEAIFSRRERVLCSVESVEVPRGVFREKRSILVVAVTADTP